MGEQFYAVVPAGGSGTRLWPLSRSRKPKFLLPLPGPRTMLQETVERLLPLCAAQRIMVVTGAQHQAEVRYQLPSLESQQIVVEPCPRGSGPAIGLATAIIFHRDPDAIVSSFAADHIVADPIGFAGTVRAAIEAARRGRLVTIGITPSYPETGYGYIRSGESLGDMAGVPVCAVAEFREKPDLELATQYVASDQYLWNASMFVWQARTLLEEMDRYLPDLSYALRVIAAAWDTPGRERVMADIWPHVADVTIDQGILERSDRVAVVPGRFGWSDLGDWHGFGSVVADDPEQNVVINAELLTIDAHRAVVIGNQRMVALLGLDDVVVIDTDDALLVCHRSRAQEVKHMVDRLKQRGSIELV